MPVLGAIPVVLVIVAWSFSIANLVMSTTPGRFTVGHVVAGLGLDLHESDRPGLEHPPPGAKHVRRTGSAHVAIARDRHGIAGQHDLGDRRARLEQRVLLLERLAS